MYGWGEKRYDRIIKKNGKENERETLIFHCLVVEKGENKENEGLMLF